jgi:hypothetical protein
MQPPFSRLQLYLSRGALVADTWPYVEAVSWAAVTEFTVTEDHLKLTAIVLHVTLAAGELRPDQYIRDEGIAGCASRRKVLSRGEGKVHPRGTHRRDTQSIGAHRRRLSDMTPS